MTQSTTGDVADITAGLLNAEKRGLAENQAKLQAAFEAHEAKFNADLEALAPQKPKGPEKSEASSSWMLARKCWAWLYHD